MCQVSWLQGNPRSISSFSKEASPESKALTIGYKVGSLWTLENLLEDAIYIPYSDSEQSIPSPHYNNKQPILD